MKANNKSKTSDVTDSNKLVTKITSSFDNIGQLGKQIQSLSRKLTSISDDCITVSKISSQLQSVVSQGSSHAKNFESLTKNDYLKMFKSFCKRDYTSIIDEGLLKGLEYPELLNSASISGHLDMVKSLIQCSEHLDDVLDAYILSCRHGNTEIVRYFQTRYDALTDDLLIVASFVCKDNVHFLLPTHLNSDIEFSILLSHFIYRNVDDETYSDIIEGLIKKRIEEWKEKFDKEQRGKTEKEVSKLLIKYIPDSNMSMDFYNDIIELLSQKITDKLSTYGISNVWKILDIIDDNIRTTKTEFPSFYSDNEPLLTLKMKGNLNMFTLDLGNILYKANDSDQIEVFLNIEKLTVNPSYESEIDVSDIKRLYEKKEIIGDDDN
jgi:hypothetical protein